MATKWNIDSVREFVEKESDCKLLSTEYVKTKDKLKFLCKCGNEFETNFDTFKSKNKRQCNECSKKNIDFSNNKPHSYEFVLECVNVASNGNLKLLSKEYKNSSSKLDFLCPCGKEFQATLNQIRSGKTKCNKCARKEVADKLTIEYDEVKRFIEEECSDWIKFTLLSKTYTGAHDKLCVVDSEGYKYSVNLNNLKNSYKKQGTLNRFSVSNKYTVWNIHNWLKLNNNTNTLLSKEFNSSYEKLLWRCPENHEFWSQFSTIRYGFGCPVCAKQSQPSMDFIKEEFEKRNYLLISEEYINCKAKLKYICNYHEEIGIQEIRWSNFHNQNQGCRLCGSNKKALSKLKTHDKYSKEVYDLVGDEYKVIGDYKRGNEYILMRHELCGTEYNVAPYSFLQGSRCPNCNQSKGEKVIEQHLQDKNINYKIQYRFDDCKYTYTLPFDFAIFDDNGRLVHLIEYDGEQHYYPIDFAGKGEEWANNEYKRTKRNDNIKESYCKTKNIDLISIPYWEFDNIGDILDTKLFGKLNKTKAS